MLTELHGIDTAELLTNVGIPLIGEAPEAGEIFALLSVGESMVKEVPVVIGDDDVVGVDGDVNELKNAALAALFCVLISTVLGFSKSLVSFLSVFL